MHSVCNWKKHWIASGVNQPLDKKHICVYTFVTYDFAHTGILKCTPVWRAMLAWMGCTGAPGTCVQAVWFTSIGAQRWSHFNNVVACPWAPLSVFGDMHPHPRRCQIGCCVHALIASQLMHMGLPGHRCTVHPMQANTVLHIDVHLKWF